jgi:hypothetical protein
MTAPKVIRFKNNPDARGFVVYVMEQLAGPTLDGSLRFKKIDSATAGTKKACNKLYAEMKAKHGIA